MTTRRRRRRARARAAIRLLTCDVDGVLTDGRIYVDDHGHEMKAFSRARRRRASSCSCARASPSRGSPAATRRGRAPRAAARHRRTSCSGRRATSCPPWERCARELGAAAAGLRAHRRRPARRPAVRPLRLRRHRAARAAGGARARALRHARATAAHGAVREVCELILAAQGTLAAAHAAFGGLSGDGTRRLRARSLDRLVAWSPVLLLGGLAALTYWLDAQVQPPPPRRDGSSRATTPTSSSRTSARSAFDAEGRPRQTLAAQARRALPGRRDASTSPGPALVADRTRPRRGGGHRGPRASSPATARSMTLAGNVRAVRDAATPQAAARRAADSGPVTLTTEFLHVMPEEGPRRDRRPGDDRGAAWNNPRRRASSSTTKRKTLKLKSGVRGTLQPNTTVEVTLLSPLPLGRRSRSLAAAARAVALAPLPARAEKADREKPINFSADTGDVNYQTKVGALAGNVVITQGTLTIRADRITFQQNADNSLSATAYRQPGHLPPEARRRRRVLRRLRAARRVRRREGAARALRPRAAEARAGRDPQQLHLLQRGHRALQGRRARRRRAAARRRRPRRARARHVPAEVRTPLPGKAPRTPGQGAAKAGAADAGKAPRHGARSPPATSPPLEPPMNVDAARRAGPRPMSQLAVARLEKRYKSRTVVHDVSLDVASGEVVGLLGPNGAGKTTCFYMIVGLVPPTAAASSSTARTCRACRSTPRARLGLSYLPQEASIFRKLTVAENVRAILELQDLDADALANRLDALLEDLSISHLARRAGAVAVRRRAPPRRDRPRARDPAALHPARRAVRRRRPDRRARHPEDHRLPQGARHRRADHRPQRARNARHLRPRLHHQRGAGARLGRARTRLFIMRTSGRSISASISGSEAVHVPSRMKQTLQLKLSQHLTLTPQLQQSIRLLQLSTLELNAEVERMLQENPLLEQADGDDEPPPDRRAARPAHAASATDAAPTHDDDRAGGERAGRRSARHAPDDVDRADFEDYSSAASPTGAAAASSRRRRRRLLPAAGRRRARCATTCCGSSPCSTCRCATARSSPR